MSLNLTGIFRLPADAFDERSAESDLDSPASIRARGLQHARIMMVDDEPTTLDVVKVYLEDAGYTKFITTSDSVTAMDLLHLSRPDVLLLDLVMPQVSGFDILERMRADPVLSRIPVLVLTSSMTAETKLRALELGATDLLAKPVDPSELALRLRNTLSAKAYQDRLAYYDALTDLPNRRLFRQRLEKTLRLARAAGERVAVLHAGLDRFKHINDTLGRGVGDALLGAVAQRMERSLRHGDTFAPAEAVDFHDSLARVGDDEFGALLSGAARIDVVRRAARRLQECLEAPFEVEGHELYVTASVGIALYPDDASDLETLLQYAGLATTHAKQQSPGSYQFYSAAINDRSRERLSLENRLRRAVERDELVLHYQPKVDLRTGRICGAEALVRLQHPERGIVSPGEFIPIAEEAGLIVPIGEWVLRRACRDAKIWHRAGCGVPVSVNVSSQQFRKGDLERTIREALSGAGLDGGALVVEMTESALMEKPAECVATLESIKALGVRIAIDDFGTGYSSLSYLKRFPLDELKVDQSFVRDAPVNADDAAIVTAIIVMAQSLGLAVVAEGVETDAQLAFLRERRCDHYQGFLYAKPMPAVDFAIRLARDARRRK